MRRVVAYILSLCVLGAFVGLLPAVMAQVIPGSPFSGGGGSSGLTNIATGTNAFSLAPAIATSSGSSLSLGSGADGSGTNSIALGRSATASAADDIAIGMNSDATGGDSIAIGFGAQATHAGAFIIGAGAASTATLQMVVGSASTPLTDFYFGSGVRATAVSISTTVIHASAANAVANKAGGGMVLRPGESTGTGAAGDVTIDRVPTTQASGSTLNTAVSAVKVVSKAKTVADNTATTLFVVGGLGAHTFASGQVFFSAFATDATNDQTVSGIIRWSGVDTTAGAGGETCAAAVVGTVDATAGNGGAASTGTLACTAAGTTGTDLCNVQVTCDSSLNVSQPIYYMVVSNCATCTITPQ